MGKAHILVVDDEPDIRELVKEILEDEGYRVSVAEGGNSANTAVRESPPDIVLLDIWMPDLDGITLLKGWADVGMPFSVIMMSGHGSVETAVEATRLGAFDFIEKPIALAKLLVAVERALEGGELRPDAASLRGHIQASAEPVGHSDIMQGLRQQASRVAKHEAWVLVSGEKGTGKKLLAHYIHTSSSRATAPFVTLSSTALSSEQANVELYGQEREGRAFSGHLEQADGGTLLIEEVAELTPDLQQTLCNALEKKQFLRVGGSNPVPLDVRVIATSSADLESEVRAGRFREQLFYLLNVVPIEVPPLRERLVDVPDLVQHYGEYFPLQDGLPYRQFSIAAQNRLRNYSWPGNVCELRNIVQRLLIMVQQETIELADVDTVLADSGRREGAGESRPHNDFELPLREARELFERRYFIYQLKRADGSVGKVAKLAGLERTHLYRKLRALNIDPKNVDKVVS